MRIVFARCGICWSRCRMAISRWPRYVVLAGGGVSWFGWMLTCAFYSWETVSAPWTCMSEDEGGRTPNFQGCHFAASGCWYWEWSLYPETPVAFRGSEGICVHGKAL
jgi:hypothetical protein